MDNEIDLFALEALIIRRLRTDNFPIDFNGHFSVGGEESISLADTPVYEYERQVGQTYMEDRTNKHFVDWYNLHMLTEKHNTITPAIVAAWENAEKTEWVPIANNDCHECGERVFTYFNGIAFMFAEADSMRRAESTTDPVLRCKFDGGLKEYSVEVDVPSGRLVFANDFRDMMEETEDHYVNYSVGIYNTVLDAAKQGFLTAFVGNTCPSVMQDGDTLVIGNEGHDDDDNVTDPLGGTYVDSICTDLWWFYAVDGDAYDNSTRGYKSEVEVDVNVTPGRYKMTIHERGDGSYKPGESERFATISLLAPL